jgi:alpha-1,3-rhamnosyl/mannosyltransferase
MEITWAIGATETPMGMQAFERELVNAIERVADSSWRFAAVRVAPHASGQSHVVRLPSRIVKRRWGGVLLGRALFRGKSVHRLDLRLPPAPREVLTIHDLPPLRFGDEGRLPRHARSSAKRALAIVCPSRFAANEVQELLRVDRAPTVVPYGLSSEYRAVKPADDALLRRLGIDRPFVVHAAGATVRKNLAGLAGAWRLLLRMSIKHQLVLIGPPDARRNAAFHGLDGVVLPGFLESALVARLMARSAAVVVPSTYEGFGLPALEGMACGVPVVASRTGALPEVVGDCALLVEPTPEGLAEGLGSVIDDDELAAGFRDAGPRRAAAFSWDEAAVKYLRVYEAAFS